MADTAAANLEAADSEDEVFRETATRLWCNGELQIDEGAEVSASDAGAWVRAWVWVSNNEAGIEDLPETDEELES